MRNVMAENIKYYPRAYIMSDALKSFFTAITNSKDLQEQLYNTNRLSEVASIANKLGFDIKLAEVVKAQAGRVLAILDEKSDDVQNLVSGIKPKTGAQWGRGGGGFLDSAGYWLIQLSIPESLMPIEKQINKLIHQVNQDVELKKKLISVRTFNELAQFAISIGYDLLAVELLEHQAQKILSLNDNAADQLGSR